MMNNPKSSNSPAPAEITRESDLLRMLEEALRDRLPRDWTVKLDVAPRVGTWRPDAVLEVSAPNGDRGVALVEAQLGLEPRSVEDLVAMLERARVDAEIPAESRAAPLIVARYISPRAQALLEELGASFADATGNMRFNLARPPVFIRTEGAKQNPWAEVRDLRSLKGRSAARVVRALCDLAPPFQVTKLAALSETSAGSASRVVELLEREALIERDPRKAVTSVDVGDLIARWADDFRFSDQNQIRTALEPRSLESLFNRLRGVDLDYAITGSFAANEVAPTAVAKLLVIYADDADAMLGSLALREVDSGSNVWIAAPPDDLPFVRTWKRDGLRYAALSQVACDLFDLPGRSPQEAEELAAWLERNPGAIPD